jgi:hypothetical protein
MLVVGRACSWVGKPWLDEGHGWLLRGVLLTAVDDVTDVLCCLFPVPARLGPF